MGYLGIEWYTKPHTVFRVHAIQGTQAGPGLKLPAADSVLYCTVYSPYGRIKQGISWLLLV